MIRDVVRLSGVIAGEHRRALDPTVFDGAVLCQDTMAKVTTQMRRVRMLVPELEPYQVFVHEENIAGDQLPAAYETKPTSLDRTHLIAPTRSSIPSPATLNIGHPGRRSAVNSLGVSPVLTVVLGSMRTTSAPSTDTGWWCTPRATTYSCPGPSVMSPSSRRMVSEPFSTRKTSSVSG